MSREGEGSRVRRPDPSLLTTTSWERAEPAIGTRGPRLKTMNRPSGDQAGSVASHIGSVPQCATEATSDPFAFITSMDRPVSKAICLPSGDHAGQRSPLHLRHT